MITLPVETLPTKKVFGQIHVSSLDTYFESVRREKDRLDIKVAGPDYYENDMVIELLDEEELLRTFQPKKTYSYRDLKSIEDLSGYSITAFYQAGILIGFQRR